MTGDFIQLGLGRWLHIMSGVMWIGLLWYFNMVQTPGLKAAGADGTAPGITKHIAPRALEYFRWAALLTVLFGLMILGSSALDVLLFRDKARIPLSIGGWLGIIMMLNVWALIWPNQKKVLNLQQYATTPASDAEKGTARRVALLASRVNMMLSIPMLFMMSFSYTFHRPMVG